MKSYFIISVLFAAFLFYSCGSDISSQSVRAEADSVKIASQTRFPSKLPANKSVVKGMIESIYVKDKDEFFIKARILSIKTEPGIPSFAVTGASYILVPSFQTDKNNKVINSTKNDDIASLIHLRSGDTFNAVISYKQFQGWFINDVNNK